jgi:hypothetical protein
VQEENDVELTLAQTSSLVMSIFKQAGKSGAGTVSRVDVREALNETKVLNQVQAIKSESASLEDLVVSQVMQSLEAVDGGFISQNQVLDALREVAQDNNTSVDQGDLSSIMSRLFLEADSRSNRMVRRQDLRKVLSKYKNGLQCLKQKEPVWQRIMRNLEDIDTNVVSKADLAVAISKAYGQDKISPA